MNLKDDRRPESSTSDLSGVWSRVWEEDPLGDAVKADTTTLVLWTQSTKSGIYIDIRLPFDAPGRSIETARSVGYDPTTNPNPSALQATGITLPPIVSTTGSSGSDGGDGDNKTNKIAKNTADISKLLSRTTQVKSFAGILEYTIGDATKTGEALRGDHELARLVGEAKKKQQEDQQQQQLPPLSTCFWKRIIDYQPPTGGYDIGVCAPYPIYKRKEDNGVKMEELRETGDDATYAELWRRMPRSSSPSPSSVFAMELVSEENGDTTEKIQRHGYWIRTDQFFAYAVGRPNTVEDAVKLGCVPQSHELNGQNEPSSCNVVGKSLKDAIDALAPIPPARIAVPTTNNDADCHDEKDKTMPKTAPNPRLLSARMLQLDILGSYVCLFGKIDDNDEDGSSSSTSSWTILHSTDPGLLGCKLVGDSIGQGCYCCSTASLASESTKLEVGATIVQSIAGEKSKLRRWKVVEMDGPTGLPGL